MHSPPLKQLDYQKDVNLRFLSVVDRRMKQQDRQRRVRDNQLQEGLEKLHKSSNFKNESVLHTIKAMRPSHRGGVIPIERPITKPGQQPSPQKPRNQSPQRSSVASRGRQSPASLKAFVARTAFEKYKEMGSVLLADSIGDRGSTFSKQYPQVIAYADLQATK